jgi:stringent starvation protein B
MTELLKQQLEASLTAVQEALGKWQDKELGVFDAHAELLKHAARAERLAERMARLGLDNASSLMRDAYDVGLVGRDEFIELVGREPEQVEPSPDLSSDDAGRPMVAALPNKRDLVEDLLGAGPVLVHVDARNGRVRVPENFRSDPKLVLRFGYGLTPAIIDLSVDDEAISGTLTFSGVPHRCVLPWEAVYAVVSEVDQKGMVWPDDVPGAVVEELTGVGGDGDEEAELEADPEPVAPPVKKRGGHLKLVK